MGTQRVSVWAVALLGLWCVGCFGPITATKELSDAERAMERARVADAHEKAPYEYHTAEHYLRKSKEEWGYSDFQASDEYAAKARRNAERALTKAKEDPYTGSPVPEDKLSKARMGVEQDEPDASSPADILEDVNAMEEEDY